MWDIWCLLGIILTIIQNNLIWYQNDTITAVTDMSSLLVSVFLFVCISIFLIFAQIFGPFGWIKSLKVFHFLFVFSRYLKSFIFIIRGESSCQVILLNSACLFSEWTVSWRLIYSGCGRMKGQFRVWLIAPTQIRKETWSLWLSLTDGVGLSIMNDCCHGEIQSQLFSPFEQQLC